MQIRKAMAAATAAIAALIALFGCGRDPRAGQAVLTCEVLVMELAARRWDAARPMLSGAALDAVDGLIPLLDAAAGLQTRVTDFRALGVRTADDEAEVVASYVQEQTVPGYGTTLQRLRVKFWLIWLGGRWRVYQAAVMDAVR